MNKKEQAAFDDLNEQLRIAKAFRFAERAKPMAWMTFCPSGHEFDYRVFLDETECRDVANEYAMETGEDEWAVYPLVKGKEDGH